jgi:hypothetical protein
MTYSAPASLVRQQQIEAWGYYGAYGAAAAMAGAPKTTVYGATHSANEAVGEVRYIVGWAADQMSRMQWDVFVDGSADWELELADGRTIRSGGKGEKSNPHTRASAEVLRSIGWTTGTVRLVTTNLYVAGEFFYVFMDDSWRVVSVIHPEQQEIFAEADHVVRGLWPSPIDPAQPDAPLFGVLSILSDMDWLGRLSRAQSANRVGMRGILGSADGLNFAGGGDFWEEWDKSLRAKMLDPTDVGPVHLRGAKELVEPMASGRGMGGLSWVVPDFPYDARIEGRMEAMIHRLAYGLPIPPEILLGLSAQSRATAFQVEENSYRAHIEPPANIVAQVATDVLNTLFEDVEVEVRPDPTLLLAKRSTVQDVKDAYDRGEVSGDYLREVLGIPSHAEPTPEERERRTVIGVDKEEGGHSPTTETPRQRAARADREDPSGAPADQKSLDPTALAEWRGRIDVATFRARDRLGAKARTHKSLRDVLPSDLPNDSVPAHLGLHALESAGLDVASVVSDSLLFLGPRSCAGDNFVDGLTEHVLATLDSADPVPLQDAELTKLLQGLANRTD